MKPFVYQTYTDNLRLITAGKNENLEMTKIQLKSGQNNLDLSKMSKLDVNCVNSTRLFHKKQRKKTLGKNHTARIEHQVTWFPYLHAVAGPAQRSPGGAFAKSRFSRFLQILIQIWRKEL